MADAKISDLTALTSVDEADVLAVVDVSAAQTKKATKAVLLSAITARIDALEARIAALEAAP